MNVKLNRIDDHTLFECTNSKGLKILLDDNSQPHAKGVSPMEAVLMAVAGCSGIDIISILKKQRQQVQHFSADIRGERIQKDEALPFETIITTFFLEGEIDPAKAKRAAELSFAKYCSVSKTLEPTAKIKYRVFVNGNEAL